MNPIRKALASLPGNWTKGGFDDAGRTCGLGHLYTFGMEDSVDFSEYAHARQIMTEVAKTEYPDRISEDLEFSYIPFAAFNDHPDTTEAEVIAVMEKAAVQYDELYGE